MFLKISRRLQRSCFHIPQERAHRALAQPAIATTAEFLEPRCLLSFSITAQELAGPIRVVGSKWKYQATRLSDGSTSVQNLEVAGPGTFNGITANSIHFTFLNTSGTTPPVITSPSGSSYSNFTSDGLVDYGNIVSDSSQGTTATFSFSPFALTLPAVMVPGQPVSNNYTRTILTQQTGQADNTTTSSFARTDTLVSQNKQSISVPAGIFSCYEVDQVEIETLEGQPQPPTTSQQFFAPGVGMVKTVTSDDPNTPIELIDFASNPDKLSFQQGGSDTASGDNIKPPIVVRILKPDGTLEASGTDSTDPVTIALNGAGGTLAGTLTVNAVGGVATFSDLSITGAGSYTFTATSTADLVSATSGSLTISAGQPPQIAPTLPRLKVPTSAVGGGNVNINANVTVTNTTGSTVAGTLKVTAFLVGPTGSVSAVPALSSMLHPNFVQTVSLQIGKTVSQHVSIKAGRAGHLTIHLTKLPDVPVAGNYSLEFVVTDTKGVTATVVGPSITVGPAVITLSETISAFKLPSTVTIGQKLKAASIKLIVKNSGNVIAKGKTSFSVSASTTSGVVGTPVTSYSTVLNTAPNKTKPVTINVKSLPALAAGSYFIVIQATDSMGNKSLVSSASPITVTA